MVPGFKFCFVDHSGDKHVSVNFVQDTSKFWYKADISREQGVPVGRGLGHPEAGTGWACWGRLRFMTCPGGVGWGGGGYKFLL